MVQLECPGQPASVAAGAHALPARSADARPCLCSGPPPPGSTSTSHTSTTTARGRCSCRRCEAGRVWSKLLGTQLRGSACLQSRRKSHEVCVAPWALSCDWFRSAKVPDQQAEGCGCWAPLCSAGACSHALCPSARPTPAGRGPERAEPGLALLQRRLLGAYHHRHGAPLLCPAVELGHVPFCRGAGWAALARNATMCGRQL